jgi:hypothetical protein
MDATTAPLAATLRGAALREVDYSKVHLSQDQVNAVFGDGTVILPKGLTRPAHWPEEELDVFEFHTQWDEWRKTLPPDSS